MLITYICHQWMMQQQQYNTYISMCHLQVHGAGSYGHFQASQYGVARGGNNPAAAVQGFVETRRSVTQLNHAVVSALIDAGVPAVGLSPVGTWSCSGRQLQDAAAGVASVQAALDHNLVRTAGG
jgi:isopentenyl phosphate kinase